MRIRIFSISFCGVQNGDWAKHALSLDFTLITALFSIISRGISIWHPARMGFSLFTLTIKLMIRNSAHPLSRSGHFSSDANVGSMTCRSYHSHISVNRYISMFFIFMHLLVCLSFIANSPLNAVFTFTLPSFYSISHSLKHYIASVF